MTSWMDSSGPEGLTLLFGTRRGEALLSSQESGVRQSFHSKNKLVIMLKGEIQTEKSCNVPGQN